MREKKNMLKRQKCSRTTEGFKIERETFIYPVDKCAQSISESHFFSFATIISPLIERIASEITFMTYLRTIYLTSRHFNASNHPVSNFVAFGLSHQQRQRLSQN